MMKIVEPARFFLDDPDGPRLMFFFPCFCFLARISHFIDSSTSYSHIHSSSTLSSTSIHPIHPIHRHQSHPVSNPSLSSWAASLAVPGSVKFPCCIFFFYSMFNGVSIGVHSSLTEFFPPPTTLPALLLFFTHDTAHRRFLNADSGLCSGLTVYGR